MNNASYEHGEATRNKIVESIKNYQKKKGYSPSVSDIQKETGIKSKSTIHNQLKILEESGRITREKGSSRTLKVVEEKRTNADRIRSMSDEELAELLSDDKFIKKIADDFCLYICRDRDKNGCSIDLENEPCPYTPKDDMLAWLQLEVEE